MGTPIQHVTYKRNVAWWPFTTGPHYGDIPRDYGLQDDVIVTPVGSFRTGEALAIPQELTGTLAGLAEGRKQYFLVQLRESDLNSPDWPQVLASYGAEVMEQNPVNSLVLRLDQAAYSALSASPMVRFIEPYHPAYRIMPSIGRMPQATPEQAVSPIFNLRVTLFPGEPLEPVVEALAKMGASVTRTMPAAVDGARAKIELTAAAPLIPMIAHLEPVVAINETSVTNLYVYGSIYFQSETGSPDFVYWKAQLDGDGQIISVTDTGLSVNSSDHADTAANSGWTSAGNGTTCATTVANHRKLVCYTTGQRYGSTGDYNACDSITEGRFAHGQVVTSAALGNATRGRIPAPLQPSPTDCVAPGCEDPNKTWVRDFGPGKYIDTDKNNVFSEFRDEAVDGIAKGARVVFVDIDSSCPDGQGFNVPALTGLINGLWADFKANIHNFSFGSDAGAGGPSYTLGGDDIDTAINANPINVVAIAAGNAGPAMDSNNNPYYGSTLGFGNIGNEASCKNCIAVGASDGTGGTVLDFTSEGPAFRNATTPALARISPVIFAQGYERACFQVGTANQTGAADCLLSELYQGTSFASPNIAGAAAVIREYLAEGFYPDGTRTNPNNNSDKVPTISARAVKAIMIAGTKPMVGGKVGLPEDRFNNVWGYGQLFLTRALPLADAPTTVPGLIIHDLPGNIDGVAGDDGVSDLSMNGTISSGVDQVSDFQVLDWKDDLAVALAWSDNVNATGVLAWDLDLEVRYCGADGTCGNADDEVYQGNAFSEDPDRDATGSFDLDADGTRDGYFYNIPNSKITAGGGAIANWRDRGNNTEAVFVPTFANAPDLAADGTKDLPALSSNAAGANPRTGLWRVTVHAQAGVSALPFAVAIAGPVAAGSSVRFDTNPVTCNGDVGVIVSEKDDEADTSCRNTSNCPTSVISGRTTIQVVNAAGTVVDTESGLAFTKLPNTLNFETTGRLPLTTEMPSPVNSDGILSVEHGHKLRVTYADTEARQANAEVDCRPALDVWQLTQVGRDTFFSLVGGCDDDRYLDVGESFSITFQYFNTDPVVLKDTEVSLKIVQPDGDNDTDPCRTNNTPYPYITLENPTKSIGDLDSVTLQQTTFVFKVNAEPPTKRDRIEFVLGIKSRKAGQGIEDCFAANSTSAGAAGYVDAFQLLAQADDQINYFITDCPTGCTLNFDRNANEKFEDRIPDDPEADFNVYLRGKDETLVNYGDMTSIVGRTETPGCTDCGNPGFNGPWNFDADNEGFRSGRYSGSETAPGKPIPTNWGEDSNWDGVLQSHEDQNINSTLDQNWNTKGGCGFMTGTSATVGGIWHTGTIGTYNDNNGANCRATETNCQPYDISDGTTGTYYWIELLRTPVIHPVRSGTASDGYDWKTQVLDWSWNMQFDGADSNYSWYWEFDLDTAQAYPSELGDGWIQWRWDNNFGLISGGQLNILGGGHAFAPTNTDNEATGTGSGKFGDGKNGTLGGNRSGVRGCFFNDLNLIGDPPTNAWFTVKNPSGPDDDCDNEWTLGADGCPGTCWVDDDANGVVDDRKEICPCKKCEAGSPRANQVCYDDEFCNTTTTTTWECVSATNASGRPTAFGDDSCGDGTVDENVAATFGTNTSLRQIRNFELIRIGNSSQVGLGGNTLEDLWGPTGTAWAGEIGWGVFEGLSDPAIRGYGMGIDDMVVEWQESHPVAQVGNKCNVSNPAFNGQCASINLGSQYTTNGDGEIPVTVLDPYIGAGDNLVDCDGDGQLDNILVEAYATSERVPETFCLERTSAGGSEFTGIVRTTTRINRAGDHMVFVSQISAAETPAVVVRYFDKYDGVHNTSVGPDGQPGDAGFDDDGDGTVDNASELCSSSTNGAAGRTPHPPYQKARWSDDSCGCINNPVAAQAAIVFDLADVVITKVTVWDGNTGNCAGKGGNGDCDGFADPNETVVVDVIVRNFANFPLDNVVLTLASSDPKVECMVDDEIRIPVRLAEHNPATGSDQYDTSTGADHFKFKAGPMPASGPDHRNTTTDDIASKFNVSLQGLAKALAGATDANGNLLVQDVPIFGTAVPQSFEIVHYLNSGLTGSTSFTEDFESYRYDRDYDGTGTKFVCNVNTKCVLDFYKPFTTGSDAEELLGTHCQTNNPNNPYGNNTAPEDYCEIGEGYDNNEQHWHLHANVTTQNQGVCENKACPGGARSATVAGQKSLSNANIVQSGSSLVQDGLTLDMNRMNWVEMHRDLDNDRVFYEANENFQLGDAPEFTYWTQLSITDWRLFGEAPESRMAWDAAQVAICVDANNDGRCNTTDYMCNRTMDANCTNTSSGPNFYPRGNEKWEPLHAYFSPEQSFRLNNWINCMYDPSDDGNNENMFFENSVRTGPSSTCAPEPVDTCVGRTKEEFTADLPNILGFPCWPETGEEGKEGKTGNGPGKWIQKKFDLRPWRGQRVLFRFHHSPGGIPGYEYAEALSTIGVINRDDGWFIDDINITGLATGGSLAIDSTGAGSPQLCPTSNCTTMDPSAAAIPYPRNDRNLQPKPAVACTDVNTTECDFDKDGTVDTGTNTGDSDAAGRPFILDAQYTSADQCLEGAIEYRFRDGATVLQDWSTNREHLVDPAVTTTYTVDARCSSAPACAGSVTLTINVPGGIPQCQIVVDSVRLASNKSTISWQGSAGSNGFDTAKGTLSLMLAAHNYNDAACLPGENNSMDSQATDAATPATGNGFYYLSRCDGGTWGDPQVPSRSLPNACP
ncbi:MAG: S8 family serine peptidase [Acidobacteria bacterium]|nr:S8 family serine peptidase [Acidobacteriota bacterium]